MSVKNISPRTEVLERCPICEGKNTKIFFSSPDRLHGIPGEFSYHQCNSCRTVFQNPMVIAEDLHLCYPSDYYTHNPIEKNQRRSVSESLKTAETANGLGKLQYKIRLAIINRVKGISTKGFSGGIGKALSLSSRIREKAFFDHVRDELLPFAKGNLKALEIGCGAGQTLVNLRHAGWEVEGIEWNERSAQAAREYSNVPVWVGDFLDIDLPKNNFHLIFLHHVFEHLREPLKSLERISELLVEGGRLVLVYPNPGSLGARLYKEFWHPWETPRHLVFAPIRTIVQAAKKYGLKAIKTKTISTHCAGFSSVSRLFKLKKTVDLTQHVKITGKDKALQFSEGLFMAMGFSVGEEILIVLSKNNQSEDN